MKFSLILSLLFFSGQIALEHLFDCYYNVQSKNQIKPLWMIYLYALILFFVYLQNNNTALHTASDNGQSEIVSQLLLHGGNVNAKGHVSNC